MSLRPSVFTWDMKGEGKRDVIFFSFPLHFRIPVWQWVYPCEFHWQITSHARQRKDTLHECQLDECPLLLAEVHPFFLCVYEKERDTVNVFVLWFLLFPFSMFNSQFSSLSDFVGRRCSEVFVSSLSPITPAKLQSYMIYWVIRTPSLGS